MVDEFAFDNIYDGVQRLLERACGDEYRTFESTGNL